jgi:hypothetical protein
VTIFPSQQALELADELFAQTARMAAGYEERMGTTWYWRLPEGVLVGFRLDQTGAQERWDVIRGEAATVEAGVFAQVDFPFIAYARSTISVPYLRDIHGEAQWIHTALFDVQALLGEMSRWLWMLGARAVATLSEIEQADLSDFQARLVRYALEELGGAFVLKDLHQAFKEEISKRRLSVLARAWEEKEWLSPAPRKVLAPLQRAVGWRAGS